MSSSEVQGQLRQMWRDLWRGVGNAAVPEVDGLFRRYAEQNRHYHTGGHILDCLRQYARYAQSEQVLKSPALTLAIFYHDAVYDPRARDNEAQSAQLAVAELAGAISQPLCADVTRLILATDHRLPAASEDEQLMVDIDLSILGRSAVEFDAYERAIRAEYSFVPPDQFCAGRATILDTFLSRPRIFQTNYFFTRYEAAARDNLARSIAQLKAGLGRNEP